MKVHIENDIPETSDGWFAVLILLTSVVLGCVIALYL